MTACTLARKVRAQICKPTNFHLAHSCSDFARPHTAALAAFQRLDRDKSGSLDAHELQRALKLLHLNLTAEQIKPIIDELDSDGDGDVDIGEFMRLVWDGKLDRIRKKLRG
eukprot:SAG31_NODE_7654_length_1628_cov_31.831262_2_plen_110_part_01